MTLAVGMIRRDSHSSGVGVFGVVGRGGALGPEGDSLQAEGVLTRLPVVSHSSKAPTSL